MVSENRVLRRIFGPSRDEVMGGLTKNIFRPFQLYIVLKQETNTIFIHHFLISHVFRKAHIILASEISTIYQLVSEVL
jgi:hypothetical protein